MKACFLLSAVLLGCIAVNGTFGTECEPQVCSNENDMLEKLIRLELKVEQLNKELQNAEDLAISLSERRRDEISSLIKKSDSLSETVAANTMKIESTIAKIGELKGAEANITHTVPAIGFTACYSKQETTRFFVGDDIVFGKVMANIGGAYNANDGKFTAPFRGMYVFHLAAMTKPGEHQYVRLVKDGNIVDGSAELVDARGVSAYATASFQWVIDLNKNSEVWIEAHHDGYLLGFCHSMLTGFLVSAL